MKKLETLVFEALGSVSMCWSETPKGVFESTKAKEIGDRLLKDITALQQSEWISVEQATPHDGMYLCLVEQTQQCGTIWKVQKVMQNLFNNWVVIHNESVTHWMPLPTPPNK